MVAFRVYIRKQGIVESTSSRVAALKTKVMYYVDGGE